MRDFGFIMISVILKLIKKLIRYLFARAVKIRAASGRDLKAQGDQKFGFLVPCSARA